MPVRTLRPTPVARVTAAAAGLAALALGAGACGLPSGDLAVRPADGIFHLTGHGWGHGRGMSQYGAYGGALLGVPARTMLDTYYPGTATTTMANTPIRVRVSADEGHDTVVRAAAGVVATDGATGRSLTLPSGPSRWRAVVDGTSLHLQKFGTAWTTVPLGGATSLAGPVRFSVPGSATGVATLGLVLPNGTSVDYRGSLSAVRTGTGTLASIATMPMESYLLGVVPREMPASWPAAALQVQAVAARTYAARYRSGYGSMHAWDICDSTACQVFAGTATHQASGWVTSNELATSNAAVAATAGQVRTLGGYPISAEFSSSDGGWTVDGGVPWETAHADPWDGVAGGTLHTWTATVSATAIERRWPSIGHLTRIRVTSRDGNGEWGGRVRTVVLEGTSSTGKATTMTTTGDAFAWAFPWPGMPSGLRSSWWHVDTATAG